MEMKPWVQRKVQQCIREYAVTGAHCARCGVWMEPEARIGSIPVKINGHSTRVFKPSNNCRPCRTSRPLTRVGKTKWGGTDYHALAEKFLYPQKTYHDLTPLERRHTYFLARLAWFYDGNLRHLMGWNSDADTMLADERTRLTALRLSLARMGFRTNFSPLTDWMDTDGNTYADVGRHTPRTPAFGRAADAHRDAAGAEAQGDAAAGAPEARVSAGGGPVGEVAA